MILIDVRKFITELGKLLSFMYEEDRNTALSLYEEMFRSASDPSALLQMLGSPTKQAVAIARVYNAKERKLAVTSQEGAGEAAVATSECPPFVAAINSIKDEAILRNILSAGISPEEEAFFTEDPLDDSFLFAEDEPLPAQESAPADPFAALQDFTKDLPAEAAAFMASTGYTAPQEDAPSAELDLSFPEEDFPSSEEDFHFDLGPVPEKPRTDPSDIDEALATFRRRDDEPMIKTPAAENTQTKLPEFDAPPAKDDTPWKKQPEKNKDSSVVSIPKMILYILIAVPLTALGVLILLIPAVLFLALAVACGLAGFNIIAAAFGNFAVFADIMVVIGVALAFVALTLLFFWLFIWFIAGAIASLINVSIRLGGKFCYREEKA